MQRVGGGMAGIGEGTSFGPCGVVKGRGVGVKEGRGTPPSPNGEGPGEATQKVGRTLTMERSSDLLGRLPLTPPPNRPPVPGGGGRVKGEGEEGGPGHAAPWGPRGGPRHHRHEVSHAAGGAPQPKGGPAFLNDSTATRKRLLVEPPPPNRPHLKTRHRKRLASR